jgi:hypothetical protein
MQARQWRRREKENPAQFSRNGMASFLQLWGAGKMRRYVKPAVRKCANTSAHIASQVTVAVITALVVAFITNFLVRSGDEPATFAPGNMAAFGDASGARQGPPLPPLETVVIEEIPAPLSQTPGALAASNVPAGLYYAETEQRIDPLTLLAQAGT